MGRVVLPGLVEKLELAPAQTMGEPLLGGAVEDGLVVEKGNRELGEGVGVLWERMYPGADGWGDEEEEDGRREHGRDTRHDAQ
jgi:hypothetical protein